MFPIPVYVLKVGRFEIPSSRAFTATAQVIHLRFGSQQPTATCMEALAFSGSDDSDSTDVIEYEEEDDLADDEDMLSAEASDEDMTDGVALGIEEAEETQLRNCCVIVADANDGGGMSAVDTRDDYDSDSSLEYEYDGPASGPCVKETYQSVGFYDNEDVAEQYLHRLNQYVYTYKTRYLSTFRVGKKYRCRSHKKGQHTGEAVNLTPKGILPIIKPEVDALLKLRMSAGRVRNMLLFKYLRDPNMLALVPKTKKMENRKAYLKRQAGEGWEINNFVTLRNWTCTKLCQTHAEFVGVDPDNVADMNDLIVLDES
ncbi:unnamed protein product [Phytophthora fragariaefolia]|uniref:Unnamed protein product n=1 Tax=Phytophthora fragariaefolia TaxID=1490495 RepID=A0A9W6Y071_9STRA|nr:unnamed protein product [Phytophthora fragariaefolia]